MEALPVAEIERVVAELGGWDVTDGGTRIRKSFRFDDFVGAFAFMTAVALKAERLDHHPDWTNVYSRVDVTLWTHVAGGVTQLDIDLARFMDGVASRP